MSTFLIFCFHTEANQKGHLVLKSFNFKLYYTEGGKELALQTIKEAENSLEQIENFLGTRLIEQIDIFLSETPEMHDEINLQRNGIIIVDNSSIYLHYKGNSSEILTHLKEQLAEILINGMLYGNTIKERLKNNREINVPDWYVSGLAKYVAYNKVPSISWMADYYEEKLNLNLNLTNPSELAEIGHAVFCYINDTFGINKLKQILFYTKLSGKTDYAFQLVLNKSVNWVLADWFKMEKAKYLKESSKRLPRDPEPIGDKLLTAEILQLNFSQDGLQLNFLIRTLNKIELWNYEISSQKLSKIYQTPIINNENIWCFLQVNKRYYIAESDGSKSAIYTIEAGVKPTKIIFDFNYILKLKHHPIQGIALLAQKNYQIDLIHWPSNNSNLCIKLTNSMHEETDFVFDDSASLIFSSFDHKKTTIQYAGRSDLIYQSHQPLLFLNTYLDSFISFIQCEPDKNIGSIVNRLDSSEQKQVTNYTRSISSYDYCQATKKVMEGLHYGKQNYIVISDASLETAYSRKLTYSIDTLELSLKALDTFIQRNYSYHFITGFEYKIKKNIKQILNNGSLIKKQLRVKELIVPNNEIKASSIQLGFTNAQFQSPLFAYFMPVAPGINNGANLTIGCKIKDIHKKYFISASLRQPLTGKGTDFDMTYRSTNPTKSYGVDLFGSTYQSELYNQGNKYVIKQIRSLFERNFNPRLRTACELGWREDTKIPLYLYSENSNIQTITIRQPFIKASISQSFNFKTHLNYSQKLRLSASSTVFKPLNKTGFNTNVFLNIKHEQSFFRLFHLTASITGQSSIGKQKTVFLFGGLANWLFPQYGQARLFNTDKILMYSTVEDFAGLPFNYQSGTSIAIGKLNLTLPLNPLISQQNFNQIFFKYLTLRSYVNIGMPWFGINPFSIHNPENKEHLETGSMSIINYEAKNPLIWSWGTGLNTIIFGYELGLDYAFGYQHNLAIGNYLYITIGKTIF